MLENWKESKMPVRELGLEQFSDGNAILEIIRKVVRDNPKSVKDYKTGMNMAIAFLACQAMRASNGGENPQTISKIPNDIPDSM